MVRYSNTDADIPEPLYSYFWFNIICIHEYSSGPVTRVYLTVLFQELDNLNGTLHYIQLNKDRCGRVFDTFQNTNDHLPFYTNFSRPFLYTVLEAQYRAYRGIVPTYVFPAEGWYTLPGRFSNFYPTSLISQPFIQGVQGVSKRNAFAYNELKYLDADKSPYISCYFSDTGHPLLSMPTKKDILAFIDQISQAPDGRDFRLAFFTYLLQRNQPNDCCSFGARTLYWNLQCRSFDQPAALQFLRNCGLPCYDLLDVKRRGFHLSQRTGLYVVYYNIVHNKTVPNISLFRRVSGCCFPIFLNFPGLFRTCGFPAEKCSVALQRLELNPLLSADHDSDGALSHSIAQMLDAFRTRQYEYSIYHASAKNKAKSVPDRYDLPPGTVIFPDEIGFNAYMMKTGVDTLLNCVPFWPKDKSKIQEALKALCLFYLLENCTPYLPFSDEDMKQPAIQMSAFVLLIKELSSLSNDSKRIWNGMPTIELMQDAFSAYIRYLQNTLCMLVSVSKFSLPAELGSASGYLLSSDFFPYPNHIALPYDNWYAGFLAWFQEQFPQFRGLPLYDLKEFRRKCLYPMHCCVAQHHNNDFSHGSEYVKKRPDGKSVTCNFQYRIQFHKGDTVFKCLLIDPAKLPKDPSVQGQ